MTTLQAQMGYDATVLFLAIVFIFLRFFLRKHYHKSYRTSHAVIAGDVFAVIALCAASILLAFDLWIQAQYFVAQANGEKVAKGWTVPARLRTQVLKMYLFYDFGYMVCFWSVKAAFLCNYFNLRRGLTKARTVGLYVVSIFTAITFIIVVLSYLLWCRPMRRYWSLGPDYCGTGGILELTIIISVCHVTSDIGVIGFGFLVISALQLRRREKIGLAFIFALGILTVVTALVRFGIQVEWIEAKKRDESSDITGLYLATVAEILGAILAVSLPVMRVWLRSFFNSKEPHSGGAQSRLTFSGFGFAQSILRSTKSNQSKHGDIKNTTWPEPTRSSKSLQGSIREAERRNEVWYDKSGSHGMQTR